MKPVEIEQVEQIEQTYEEQIVELITRAGDKKLVATHFGCADGMMSALEFFRLHGGFDEFQLIPLEYGFLRDEALRKALENTTFEAVLDFGPVGKHIRYFADHHQSNITKTAKYEQEGRVEHNFFDPNAPSGVSVVDVYAKKVFGKGVTPFIFETAGRSDTAQFSSAEPTTWEEFWQADSAWQYTYLAKAAKETPQEFVDVIHLLYEKKFKEIVMGEPYHARITELLERSKEILELSKGIELDTITIIVNRDEEKKHLVNRNLMFRLDQQHKYTVICTINARSEVYRLSFGVTVGFPEEELEPFRTDQLAEHIGRHTGNGGGHKRASGASFPKSEEMLQLTLTEIKEHFAGRDVKVTYV